MGGGGEALDRAVELPIIASVGVGELERCCTASALEGSDDGKAEAAETTSGPRSRDDDALRGRRSRR